MADDVGQDLEVKGSTYRIPKMEDVADAVVAFRDYSHSIPYSEYIETRTITVGGKAIEPVTKEDNGKMIVVQVDTTLQFGDLPEGFSVACVADAGATITYQGVDKNGQKSTQYQVGTVVTVGGLNILSLASPYDGEIGGEGGGAGGGGLKWAKSIESEADLAGLDADVVAAQEPDLTLWMRCGTGPWREMCGPGGGGVPPDGPSPIVLVSDTKSGVVLEYEDGGVTWRHHEIRETEQIEIVTAGYVETLLVLGGGGGSSNGSRDGAYPGGGGGAGGVFYRRWTWLEPQTISAYIGTGGSGGTNGTNSGKGGDTTVTLEGYGDTPGQPIVCGGGGGGGNQSQGGQSGKPGSNGGGTGGAGGRGASPGVSITAGDDTMNLFWLQRDSSNQQYAKAGNNGTEYHGRGGTSGQQKVGGKGVFLIRYPILPVAP